LNDFARSRAFANVVQYCLQRHLFPYRSTLIERGAPVPVNAEHLLSIVGVLRSRHAPPGIELLGTFSGSRPNKSTSGEI
jgi:hypothetical protein